MRAFLTAVSLLCFLLEPALRAQGWDKVTGDLLTAFDAFDVVALGEWHGSEQDAALRLRLIRHRGFPRKVRYIVVETGNARHQSILDRFIAGDTVRPEELRSVWRDITTPGGADAPVYEEFLHEIRRLNRTLPPPLRIRVLAADPPIDWSRVSSRDEWREVAGRRDAYAAELIEREVLGRGEKALLICGAAHLWQKNQLVKEPNVAALLKKRNPRRLYTVSRIDPSEEVEGALRRSGPATDLPILLALKQHPAGGLKANALLGLPVRMFAEDTSLGEVVDAALYTGKKDAVPHAASPSSADPVYEAEKRRRQTLLRP